MPSRQSRRLVIDASVARSTGGEDAKNPDSKRCRDFLMKVRSICHRIVMTSAIREEWNRHQSHFAREWRVSMMARKKVDLVVADADDELRNKIAYAVTTERAQEVTEKDLHLVEAAIATDRIVISRDEEARELFKTIANRVGELKRVAWANPTQEDEQLLSWLENGAKAEKKRLLGFQAGGR